MTFDRIKLYAAIGLVWLFHISGIIGIILGHKQWFLVKTPLNLLLSFGLLILVHPKINYRQALIIVVFFLIGMAVEWLGVNYGLLFGTYWYGDNLGLKFQGVPYLIGINWAMLILVTGALANEFSRHKVLRILTGASFMVLLDFFIEASASSFDFWHWENDVIPTQNYWAWFGISIILHWLYQEVIKKGPIRFATHLYVAQMLFFAFFYE